MNKLAVLMLVGSMLSLACNTKESAPGSASSAAPGTAPAAPATAADKSGAPAGETSCDAVVNKLASYESSAGDPEKKLWNKMCADMNQETRACIVASKTADERDACMKDQKLK